jgi:hypothetical protein
MEYKRSKRDMSWGVLLITFGAAALLNTFTVVSEWTYVGLLALGGLVVFGLFLTNREDWVVLIPGYILLASAAIVGIAVGDLLQGDILATTVLLLVALPFFVVYLYRPKQNWWALIPTWVLFSIGVMILLIGLGILQDGAIPLYVLSSIGLPFLLVYLLNRENWWALIPAWVMFSIGIMVFLIDARFLNDLAIPAYVMFAIALPFFFAFLVNRRSNRWALIPGGITGVIGLGFFAGTDLAAYVIPVVLIIAGGWVLLGSFGRKSE